MGTNQKQKIVRPRVFLDVSVSGKPVGRIVIELFSEIVPKTAENFRGLCTGDYGPRTHYKGTRIHRIIKDFMVQGGDITAGNGTGQSVSIYGGEFEDEKLTIRHDRPFLVSMANKGPNTNGCQFFITTQPCPHLDGKHVVFGSLVAGQDVVVALEQLETDPRDAPYERVTVVKCGELVLRKKAPAKKVESSTAESESETESSSSTSTEDSTESDSSSSDTTESESTSNDTDTEEEREKRSKKRSKKRKGKAKHSVKKSKRKVKSKKRHRDHKKSKLVKESDKADSHAKANVDGSRTNDDSGDGANDNEIDSAKANARLSKSGRLIRGRGSLRYRTPSPKWRSAVYREERWGQRIDLRSKPFSGRESREERGDRHRATGRDRDNYADDGRERGTGRERVRARELTRDSDDERGAGSDKDNRSDHRLEKERSVNRYWPRDRLWQREKDRERGRYMGRGGSEARDDEGERGREREWQRDKDKESDEDRRRGNEGDRATRPRIARQVTDLRELISRKIPSGLTRPDASPVRAAGSTRSPSPSEESDDISRPRGQSGQSTKSSCRLATDTLRHGTGRDRQRRNEREERTKSRQSTAEGPENYSKRPKARPTDERHRSLSLDAVSPHNSSPDVASSGRERSSEVTATGSPHRATAGAGQRTGSVSPSKTSSRTKTSSRFKARPSPRRDSLERTMPKEHQGRRRRPRSPHASQVHGPFSSRSKREQKKGTDRDGGVERWGVGDVGGRSSSHRSLSSDSLSSSHDSSSSSSMSL